MKPFLAFLRVMFAVLASLIGGAGCNGAAAETCERVGLCDPAPLPAEHVDIICDHSIGSTCDRMTLDETLGIVLHRVASRPGSRVRVWTLGADVATTVMVGEQTITAPKRGGERARMAYEAKAASAARDVLMAASVQVLAQLPVRRSPLAEAMTKIAMSDAGGLPRRLIAITDGREVTGWLDLECGRLPSDAQFALVLERMHALTPGLLAGVTVELAHVDGRPLERRGCAVTVARETRIQELWTGAFRAAGARQIRIASGPAVLPDPEAPSSKAREEQ